MIHIEITHSPDPNVIKNFQFFQNLIYLDRTSGNLHILDNQLLSTHLMVEVIDQDLLVHPQRDVEHYLIDGKRSTAVRKIKKGQTITIGKTSFKVIEFEFTQFKTKKEVLDEKMA